MTPAQIEDFEERAGIIEFDGKISREEAEVMARNIILKGAGDE